MASFQQNPKLEKYGFKEEYDEENNGYWMYTSYPKPAKRYRAIFETFDQSKSIEESYFWILEHLRDLGAPEFDKIKDVFAASEQSSLAGMNKQRLGMTQDKIAQYIRGINELTKQLFSKVRELRWIDERLDLYEDSQNSDSKTRTSAEVSLKGIWIDMVEGGAQNTSSVYGMAREVGFTTLPDLFFGAPPMKKEDVDRYVDGVGTNKKVRDVLKRKLRIYYNWKEGTERELNQRREFMIRSLKQIYDNIHLYIQWVKPYLNTARRLAAPEQKLESVDMATAFEGSMIELEFMAKNYVGGKVGKDACYGVVLVNFNYRTRPSMAMTSPDYGHRGPIHVGKLEINWRSYGWTEEEVQNYKKMREEEDFELISNIDQTLKQAMDSLGDELKKYINEAKKKTGEEIEEEKTENKKEEKKGVDMGEVIKSYFDPVLSIYRGGRDVGNALVNFPRAFKSQKPDDGSPDPALLKKALGPANFQAWTCYKNYKKSHGMLAW